VGIALNGSLALGAVGIALPLAMPGNAAAADYRTTVTTTPNLLGYWTYSSGPNSSVNGYTGTFLGNAQIGTAGSGPTLASDPTNAALVLDGAGDSVQTNLTDQITTQGSIVGWFNLAALPSTAGRLFAMAGESQAGNDFDLQIELDNRLRFYTDGGTATTAPTAFTAADLNQWHFVAATFVANQTNGRTIYVDGVQVAQSTPGGHDPAGGLGTFYMGSSNFFPGRDFQGRLDEFAVYNRSLSAAEVTAIYQSRLEVPEPATAGLALVAAGLMYRRGRPRLR
jgi:hypothetical protein